MDDLLNILNNDDDLNEDQLKKYVEGHATPEQTRIVEKQMADSNFLSDAVEGLQAFSQKKSLDKYVNDLNKNLHSQLEVKKQQKEKRKIKDMPWIIMAVVLILLLCLVAYAVIRLI